MNKIRIIGLSTLVTGIALFFFTGDAIGMIAGLFSGVGIGLLLSGRIKSK